MAQESPAMTEPQTAPPAPDAERAMRKTMVGTVVSDKMDKTVVVAVERRFRHPVYKKYVRTTKRYHVHDAENTCRVGDRIRIIEGRPLSKKKRWRLASIIERAK
jgi:small subunit ribosomal protein S17